MIAPLHFSVSKSYFSKFIVQWIAALTHVCAWNLTQAFLKMHSVDTFLSYVPVFIFQKSALIDSFVFTLSLFLKNKSDK